MRKFLLIAAMVCVAGSAAAQDRIVSTQCGGFGRSFGCTTIARDLVKPAPPTADDIAASDARHAKWLEFCKPVAKQDEMGVSRFSYAHAGCDVGRSE